MYSELPFEIDKIHELDLIESLDEISEDEISEEIAAEFNTENDIDSVWTKDQV